MTDVVVHTLTGPVSGPHVLVFGAIHGEEPCGTRAIERFLGEGHQLSHGTLTLVPVCNPAAFEKNKLFIEANLNRVFRKTDAPRLYEEELAQKLTALADQSDYLLDLHSATGAGDPYLFLDYDTAENKAFADSLGLSRWVVGWPDLYADRTDVQSFDTVRYMHDRGRVGVLVECGQHASPQAASVAYTCLRRALSGLGLLPFDEPAPMSSVNKARMTHVIMCDRSGQFVRPWRNFDRVGQGDRVIAYDDGSFLRSPVDGFIILPRANAKKGEEWIYFGQAI